MKKGGNPDPNPTCVVIGNGKWQLLPSWLVVWTLAMFSNTATTMVGTPCLTTANLPIPSTLSRDGKKGGSPNPNPTHVVIGNDEWQLLPSWFVPWTLAMF